MEIMSGRSDDKSFAIEVVTPARVVHAGRATTVVAPAADGYLGILANHAPMLVTLTPGRIAARNPEGAMTYWRNERGGFLEVRENRVIILADEVVG